MSVHILLKTLHLQYQMFLKEIITVLIIGNKHFMTNCRTFSVTVGGTCDHNFALKVFSCNIPIVLDKYEGAGVVQSNTTNVVVC